MVMSTPARAVQRSVGRCQPMVTTKRGGHHEASCFISTKVDPGDDIDISVIGKKRWPASRLT